MSSIIVERCSQRVVKSPMRLASRARHGLQLSEVRTSRVLNIESAGYQTKYSSYICKTNKTLFELLNGSNNKCDDQSSMSTREMSGPQE